MFHRRSVAAVLPTTTNTIISNNNDINDTSIKNKNCSNEERIRNESTRNYFGQYRNQKKLRPQPKLQHYSLIIIILIIIVIILLSIFAVILYHYFNTPTNSKDCQYFEENVKSEYPNSKSIFNCNTQFGECVWFYPFQFFHCGLGKQFNSMLQYMEQQRQSHSLWMNGPPIPLPYVSLPNKNMTISMIHIHKNAGTSLVLQLESLVRRHHNKGQRYFIYEPPTSINKFKIPPLQKQDNYEKLLSRQQMRNFVKGAVKYRPLYHSNQHTMFAVVRDPIERFISSIGQASGAYGSSHNGIGPLLRQQCISSSSSRQETLRCFINLVQNNSTWVEVHFTPQVYEIAFVTMNLNVPIAIFPFAKVPLLLKEFHADDPNRKEKHGLIHREDPILQNMSIHDYDEQMLQSVCTIYHIDVLFLSSIGYSTHCDVFLNNTTT